MDNKDWYHPLRNELEHLRENLNNDRIAASKTNLLRLQKKIQELYSILEKESNDYILQSDSCNGTSN